VRTIDSKRLAICALAAGAFFATAVTASAQDVVKVAVKDGEIAQPLTDKAGDPEAGKATMINRREGNCLACHANKDMAKEQFHGELGPALDDVASRYAPEQLRAIIVNPKEVFGPETVMPGFHVTDPGARVSKDFVGKTILSSQQVEDVVAYLVTLKE
jgi:L-cysteine S-thiosulfotransferase